MKSLPSRLWAKRCFGAKGVAVVSAAILITGCTSTVGSLDSALVQFDNQQNGSPENITTTASSSVPAPRPPSSLIGEVDDQPATEPAVTALAQSQVDGAEQATLAVVEPSDTAATQSAEFPQPPVAVATPPENASDFADQRIAQANAAPTAQLEETAAQFSPAPPVVAAAAPAAAPAQSGFLNRLFSRKPPEPKEPVLVASANPTPTAAATPVATPAPTPTVSINRSGSSSLPGVDKERLLGINQQSEEPEARPVQVASAAGLARLAPNGLRTQHSGVDVACLKPALVRVLKRVERHFGKPVVVTSGYRSPSRNSNARGAKNSLHIYCAAADIQVEGVSKWDLASYMRSMPGRGGVGTYCHTKSVHIDIGPKRDWNWRCRRG
ncbi:MAG: YcbK family protein [Pseudomonadota bacterium]